MIHYNVHGDLRNPTLVCVPGLFGGPTDFSAMIEAWKNSFHIIVLDPDHDRRKSSTAQIPVGTNDEAIFISTSEEIAGLLTYFGKAKAFVVGVSLGSKVVFDFAIKFPTMYAGGLSLDVGCGPFENTELYRFIDGMVDDLDLSIPFPEMKKLLQEKIPDRNLRTMIQTQLFYPEGKPPARWKAGMKHLGKVLSDTMKLQKIDVQFEALAQVDVQLYRQGSRTEVLKASSISAICAESLQQMRKLQSLSLTPIEDSTHFLHVTHKEKVIESVLRFCPGGLELSL